MISRKKKKGILGKLAIGRDLTGQSKLKGGQEV